MACPRGKIYNRKTKRCIADTAANRKRLGLKVRKASKRRSKAALLKPTKGACRCYYKGSEPSPKGKGYCAHCGRVGTHRIGNDGNRWEIKQRKTGALYWAKVRKG